MRKSLIIPVDDVESMFYGESIWHKRAHWQVRFAWWPVRCGITQRSLWLTRAYRGTVMFKGSGDPLYEHRWHDKHEHLMWLLKE